MRVVLAGGTDGVLHHRVFIPCLNLLQQDNRRCGKTQVGGHRAPVPVAAAAHWLGHCRCAALCRPCDGGDISPQPHLLKLAYRSGIML